MAPQHERLSYAFYSADMNDTIQHRIALEAELHRAMQEQQFEVYYQPKVSLQPEASLQSANRSASSPHIVGAEALIRWNHPERGLISPLEFIPLAEETGLILAMGEWVLRQACDQLQAWHQLGLKQLSVSVNLSGRQFSDPQLVEKVAQTLHLSGLPARYLELELTETHLQAAHGSATQAEQVLHDLKALGVGLAIDDFGTGYSSPQPTPETTDGCVEDRSCVRTRPAQ